MKIEKRLSEFETVVLIALATFRKHGYKEGGYLKGPKEYVFYFSLK